jgi:hypothetical protein
LLGNLILHDREEHKLRMSENRMLTKMFGPKRENITGRQKNCTVRSFVISGLLTI